jgi:hypothetical protein
MKTTKIITIELIFTDKVFLEIKQIWTLNCQSIQGDTGINIYNHKDYNRESHLFNEANDPNPTLIDKV